MARKPRRCAYWNSKGTQCPSHGTGNPPLCSVHRAVITPPVVEDPIIDQVLGRLFAVPQVSKIMGRVSGLLDDFSTLLGTDLSNMAGPASWAESGPRRQHPPAGRRGNPPPPPAPPPDPRELQVARARRTLGFASGEAVTPEILKRRVRELAKRWHPDRHGGNLEKMKAVNAAATLLEEDLNAKAG